ncbi:glycosyltransferase family 4 protein [Syntrophorhabdus aromaticivorans]|uniref:glycosyltransferase family 4 protein n=1 Tax=Syntrophorhabdus aromaticivorans TaxID=328301 RepID=UPI00040C6353|nr:glycosyltransferase family 4 protein [Syntrophorhabdus aromaticivorans]
MTIQRNTKRILQITYNKFPPEIRVAKEGLSLQGAGYQSAVLCPPFGDQPEYEVWNGIEVFRPRVLNKRSVLDKLLLISAFHSPSWYRAIRNVISKWQPDVLHVHDIWLGRTAFTARTTEKIVMDLHENMPAAVVEYLKGNHSLRLWFFSLVRSYRRIFAYERSLLERCDLVFAVVQEARERVLINHPALNSDQVINVENLESKRFVAEPGVGLPAFGKDHFSVLYIGGFGPHRGVDTLIRAMTPIKQNGNNIKVQLIGAQPGQYLNMLMQLIKKLGVAERVSITGWVNAENVLANIQQADVCCVPHHSNPHTDNTIPHKLYQYMIAKRPVLVSSSPPLARTVRQANAGMIFRAGDPQDCALKILAMADDQAMCAQFAANGYSYVMEQGHNWEEESAPRLVAAYDRLLNVS